MKSTPSGGICNLNCASGYTQTGSPDVVCNNGVWSAVSDGTCSLSNCFKNITFTAAQQVYISIGNCPTNVGASSPVLDGYTCQPSCKPGYFGSLTETCAASVWTFGGTCTKCSLTSVVSTSPKLAIADAVSTKVGKNTTYTIPLTNAKIPSNFVLNPSVVTTPNVFLSFTLSVFGANLTALACYLKPPPSVSATPITLCTQPNCAPPFDYQFNFPSTNPSTPWYLVMDDNVYNNKKSSGSLTKFNMTLLTIYNGACN